MSANAAESTFPAPDDYAVIVGINRYRPGIDPLRGAVNDANLFYRWVTDASGGGLNPVNVKLIVSPTEGGYEPRVSDIENEIMLFYDRLWNTGRKVGRRLYLFMAGHGIAPPDGNDCSLV